MVFQFPIQIKLLSVRFTTSEQRRCEVRKKAREKESKKLSYLIQILL